MLDIKNSKYLDEYILLCSLEWGSKKNSDEMKKYIENKKDKILNSDKYISILGLIDNDILIGFISLFKYDGLERQDLTPWYATMYVKKEFRKLGYSKILNDAILKEARSRGFSKIYLKTDLKNYYEKFGAIYLRQLNSLESLYEFKL